MSPANSQAALASLNGVRSVLAHFDMPRSAEDLAADIIDLWTGVEGSLRSLLGGSSLTGQPLIRAARQGELITIDQAHSLMEFLAARDRANRTSYKPTQADGDAAVEGFRALESALTGSAPVKRATPTSPLQAAYTPRGTHHTAPPVSPYAPPPPGGYKPPVYGRSTSSTPPPSIEQPPPPYLSASAGRATIDHALAAAEARPRRWPKVPKAVWIAVPVVLLLAVGGYFAFGRGGGELDAGIDAMQAGQREKARGEFAKAARDNPKEATPHVFLARLAREDGDLATARAQLDTALRLEPRNGVALREMGLVLFASRQYDLARRFFVRAVQANTQDRAAQGYLGCALMRLNRVEEGTKFINNGGTGPWTACLQPVTTTTPPPL